MAYSRIHSDLTERIIRSFYTVYNTLGYGFLEKVYENAMVLELQKAGFYISQQQPISVFYDGQEIGKYFADIIVNNTVILELKAAETIREEHKFQLLNYLRATEHEIGLLLNFGKSPEIKRVIFTKSRKQIKKSAKIR